MSLFGKVLWVGAALVFFTGCGSSALKARREQREKVMQSSKLYCEFLNGEEFPDIDVALNLSLAQKCDTDKPFSMSAYKTPSEISGMMYCCAVHPKVPGTSSSSKGGAKAEAKSEDRPCIIRFCVWIARQQCC